jgi:hypothetical protein
MDGAVLVFDARTLPNLHALATVPAAPKTQRRNRAVPAFATLVLALVLGMVYYVSTRQPGYTPQSQPGALSIAPVAIPTPKPQPMAEPAPVVEEPKPETSKQPVNKPATKTKTASQTQRTTEPKKEDSKVNSILKKTGRILKKPFKKF